ncbi:BTAD domain-containing putative transcriptional regulator [Actinoallomurus sp. CA-142502]|uniref:AfsR/SARP family transcriptional regulator n=1 Tax=Actinoallomurus sp. CA-142502 TaxID=3239885 RepID=UPI003D93C400
MRMRAGVLGEIEVILGDREIDVGPARRRCVLAVLLVEANRVVPVEELVRRVWDGAPPAKATASLRSHLSRLRMALMPEACAIVRRSGGYVLTMDESAVDIHHFRRLLLQARTAGDDQAAELFEEALRLWRGEPFAGLDNPWLAAVREAVRAERLAAELDYHDIELRRGRHGRLLATLWARAQEHPLNERLAAQLMLALYRDGRPADALACYQRIRDRLVDELGADPGLDLTRLHHRILTADPTLTPPAPRPRALVPAAREPSLHAFALARFAPPAPEAPARPAPATGRSDLPRDVSHFTGRTEELCRLLEDADDVTSAPVFAIDGMAGVGKTALAVHAAHRLGVRYPDGSLFLDLHGHTPGHEPLTSGAALDKLLRATGMPGAEIPDDLDERAALWRARSAGRRLLLVLDNAADSSQVRPLLPGAPGCRVLVTSRRRLVELDTTATLSLDVPPLDEALALFARVIGDSRARAEPAAAREVLGLCGRLPLAIGMVAARLRSRPAWTVGHLSGRLREERLAEIATGVAAAFTMSYEHLVPDQRRLFRLLSMHPGADCDAHLVAALLATDLNEAERLLEQLVDLHLLQQPRPGRYRFHDLLREHARSIARAEEPEASHHESLLRILDYFLFTAAHARRRFAPGQRRLPLDITHPPAHVPPLDDHSRAIAWCETEATNLTAVIDHAAEHGRHTHAWQLAHVLQHFFDIRGRTDDWISTHRRALAAADALDDPQAQAETTRSLGVAYWHAGRYEEALAHGTRSLDLCRRIGDRWGEATTLVGFGVAYRAMGALTEAFDCFEQALHLYDEVDATWGRALALTNLGIACSDAGRHDEAVIRGTQGLDLYGTTEDKWGEALALTSLGITYRRTGRFQLSLAHHERALRLNREIGDVRAECKVLNDLGHTHHAAGQRAHAEAYHRRALALALVIDDLYQRAQAHEGIGEATLTTAPDAAYHHLRDALTIYTWLGVPQAASLSNRPR